MIIPGGNSNCQTDLCSEWIFRSSEPEGRQDLGRNVRLGFVEDFNWNVFFHSSKIIRQKKKSGQFHNGDNLSFLILPYFNDL